MRGLKILPAAPALLCLRQLTKIAQRPPGGGALRNVRLLAMLALLFAWPLAAPAQEPTSALSPSEAIDKIIAQEQAEAALLRQYAPLVETYIQYMRSDKQGATVPDGDKYFIGRADLSKGIGLEPMEQQTSLKHKLLGNWGSFFGTEFVPRGFLQMIFLDENGFNRQNYTIEYARREFLGEVRCLVFDVNPARKGDKWRFVGRIWVEDQDYHIVRFDGAYGGGSLVNDYFSFDSWRTNAGKNLWLPAFIYCQQGSVRDKKTLTIGYRPFRAQTRLWGYNVGRSLQEQELSKVLVEAATGTVQDQTETANDYSPLQAERAWERQAEDNIIERLERQGLLAPRGEVDKVLETVVNNLEVTNNLDIQPEVRCRVLMTSTLEALTLSHTIIVSRGLVDVLPDEASLGAILAHELGHVVLGHRVDSQYAFIDRVRYDDRDTFKHFDFARTPEEEEAAKQKGMELFRNSPYKDKSASAQLFLQALSSRVKEIPNLISPHLGDRVPTNWNVATAQPAAAQSAVTQPPAPAEQAAANTTNGPNAPNTASVANQKPETSAASPKPAIAIVALPLGGRIKVDPWSDQLHLMKAKPSGLVAENENTPFKITPFMFYLTRSADTVAKPTGPENAKLDPDGKPQPPPQDPNPHQR